VKKLWLGFKKLYWRFRWGCIARLRSLMQLRFVLFWVVYLRYLYRVYLRRRLRVLEGSPFASENAVAHNLRMMRSTITSDRTLALIRPLSVIETLGPHREQRVLCIGPRSEGEILRVWAHGFQLNNIRGLDLISYSPWIDLGDMHAMPYPDNSFDMVICGWVIAYSENKRKAASEIVRVLRPGGIAAVGVEYRETTNEELISQCGYLPGSADRLRTVDAILAHFEGAVEEVYFRHGIVKGVNSRKGNLIAIFSVKK
jgi:SAM-dependent methyltransferase